MISRKRKNPAKNKKEFFKELRSDPNIKVDFFKKGKESEIFKLKLNQNSTILENLKLDKGAYIIKIFYDWITLNEKQINYLKELSNHELIPKIYYIDSKIIIMDFINGKTLIYFENNYDLKPEEIKIIYDNIEKMKRIWEILGFRHGDLHKRNILVTNDLNVYFIDPYLFGEL